MGPTDLRVIEHAHALFAAATLLAALAAGALGPRLARGARTAARRRLLRSLGDPLAHAPDARARDATVEGTLEGDAGDGVVALQGPTRDAIEGAPRWRAPALTLVSPIGRVALTGALDLRAGRSLRDARVGEGDATALRAGDRVRVAGVLEGVSGGDAHGDGYRDANAAWRMVPGAAGALLVAGVDVPAPQGPGLRARAALAGAALALVVITALGAVSIARLDALRGAESMQGQRLVCEGAGLRWGVVATLSPITRRRALDGIQRTLACREQRGAADIAAHDGLLRVAVGDPARRCLQRAELLHRGHRYEDAAALYESCGTDASRMQAAATWAFIARYDRASALAKTRTESRTDLAQLLHESQWHLLAGDVPAARASLARARTLSEGRSAPADLYARSYGRRIARCALLGLDETFAAALLDGEGCAPRRRIPPTRRCADDLRAAQLDEGAESWTTEHTLRGVGRESLRVELERRDVRAVLRTVRSEPPYRAMALLVALVRQGQRGEADRARLRAFVETEFPHPSPAEYDAGTLRWIAGAIDHPALLAEARAVGQRRCDAERRAAEGPAGRALSALRGY